MKKVLSTIAVAGMLLGLSGLAMAVEGDPTSGLTTTVGVSADVAKYAKLEVTSAPGTLSFSGAANETKSTTFTTHKETNCDVNYNIKITTQLTGPLGGTITTDLGTDGTTEVTLFNAAKSVWDDTFTVRGTTAGVAGQEAGHYAGEITLTVTAI